MTHLLPLLVAGVGSMALPHAALAWGDTGHHMISSLAAEALPEELPEFLRTEDMPFLIGELGREPDRWKGSGGTHDFEEDPGHYIDLDDEGRVLAGPTLEELPESRRDYDTLLREVDQTQYDAGYLYYELIGGWQQLRKDFGYWRALVAAEENATDPAQKARFARDREIREMLIVRDLGIWSHYVADASQPLHVSIHFNGWGDHPNPQGYSTETDLHGRFEGKFVQANIELAELEALVPEATDTNATTIEQRVRSYLTDSYEQVIPLYEAEGRGEFDAPNEAGEAFAATRMADAVGELRDLIVLAWENSANVGLGWPETTLADVESGADPTASFFGLD